jgi:hypothetical protein
MMTSIEIVAYKQNMAVVFFDSALSLLFRQAKPANHADAPDIKDRGKLYSHSAFV